MHNDGTLVVIEVLDFEDVEPTAAYERRKHKDGVMAGLARRRA